MDYPEYQAWLCEVPRRDREIVGWYWIQMPNFGSDIPNGHWCTAYWNGKAWQVGKSGMCALMPAHVGPHIPEPPPLIEMASSRSLAAIAKAAGGE